MKRRTLINQNEKARHKCQEITRSRIMVSVSHSKQKQVLSTKMKNMACSPAAFSQSKWRDNVCQNINIFQNMLFELLQRCYVTKKRTIMMCMFASRRRHNFFATESLRKEWPPLIFDVSEGKASIRDSEIFQHFHSSGC